MLSLWKQWRIPGTKKPVTRFPMLNWTTCGDVSAYCLTISDKA